MPLPLPTAQAVGERLISPPSGSYVNLCFSLTCLSRRAERIDFAAHFFAETWRRFRAAERSCLRRRVVCACLPPLIRAQRLPGLPPSCPLQPDACSSAITRPGRIRRSTTAAWEEADSHLRPRLDRHLLDSRVAHPRRLGPTPSSGCGVSHGIGLGRRVLGRRPDRTKRGRRSNPGSGNARGPSAPFSPFRIRCTRPAPIRWHCGCRMRTRPAT